MDGKNFKTGKIWDPKPLSMLRECDGYYKSPVDGAGNFLGPLVGYAGTYDDGEGNKKNYVGFEYYNFSRAESSTYMREAFASLLMAQVSESNIPKWSKFNIPKIDAFIGAPTGGIMLATALGSRLNVDTVFTEKRTIALPRTYDNFPGFEILTTRNHLDLGSDVIIVDGVCDDFSDIKMILDFIIQRKCRLIAIACAINCSGQKDWNGVPILAACSVDIKRYRQDDPEVAGFIADDSVFFEPVREWETLKFVMKSSDDK